MFSLFLVAGCSSRGRGGASGDDAGRNGRETDAGELYLGLAAPEHGFQIRSVGAEIGPGEEREYCEVGRLPGDPTDEYFVSVIELANAPGSHHLAFSVAPPGTQAEARLEALGVGNRTECPGARLEFGDGIEIVGTIQVSYGQSKLPDHVARRYFGGEYVVFDYHYANSGLEPLEARSAVNFHIANPNVVERVARTFGLNNLTIDVPAGETGSFIGECHFQSDVMLGGFTRHTHHWGTDFSVYYAGGARDGKEIWTSHDWQHETEFAFPEPVLLQAGEGLRYRCTYANDTARRLRFGTTVNDEMCMLYGPAWEARAGESISVPSCDIAWIDDQGIGHPGDEAGGFPKPSAADAALCEGAYGSAIDDCGKCLCDSCATPGLKCATDADCAPLLVCFAGCKDLGCVNACEPLIQQHSSAAGLLTTVVECAKVECPACGSWAN